MSATTDSMKPDSGAFRPVPKIASTISVQSLDFRKVQLPRLAVGDLDDGDAEPAEDLEIRARVAAHVGDASHEEHRHVDAALQERAGDDEAVAAVVAAAAQDGDLPLEEIAVHGFHRRHDLASGVLHEDERRDADLIDRPAIGLAHLRGVQYSHGGGRYAYSSRLIATLVHHKGHKGHKGTVTLSRYYRYVWLFVSFVSLVLAPAGDCVRS